MEKIKFRGIDKKTGNWVYGHYYEVPSPKVCFGKQDPPKCYIVFEDPRVLSDWGMPRQMVQVEVIRKTVGLYTGIRDCKRTEEFPHGQEIYKGDLLEDDERDLLEVVFQDGKFICVSVFVPGSQFITKDLVVVGNKFKNPELLKI